MSEPRASFGYMAAFGLDDALLSWLSNTVTLKLLFFASLLAVIDPDNPDPMIAILKLLLFLILGNNFFGNMPVSICLFLPNPLTLLN